MSDNRSSYFTYGDGLNWSYGGSQSDAANNFTQGSQFVVRLGHPYGNSYTKSRNRVLKVWGLYS